MSEPINRYNNDVIVDHLASNYLLGTLSYRVRRQVEKQLRFAPFGKLQLRIAYWEEKLSPLDSATIEVQPLNATWRNIEQAIKPATRPIQEKLISYKELIFHRLSTFVSVAALAWV